MTEAAGRQIRILFAEDDEICQMMTSRTLEKLGYAVTSVPNGKEAFEKMDPEKFDFVLMDIEMPVMDGLQSARLIRQKEESQGVHTPILALTGYNVPGIKEKIRDAGMDAVVDKAVRGQELHATIQSLLKEKNREESGENSDYARLEGLANAAGEKKVIASVVRVFLEEVPKQMEALEKAVTGHDAGKVAEAAHLIRGSAAVVGADLFKTDVLRLEVNAKAPECNWVLIDDNLKDVKEGYEKLTEYLKKHQ